MRSTVTLILLYFLFGWNSVSAQTQEEDMTSVLWKISSDSTKTSYIFGTMHLMSEDSFFFPDTLRSLVANSDILVMELDGEIFDPSIIELMALEEGEFFDFFTEEQLDSIYLFAEEKLFLTEDLFKTSFAKMKPFIVSQVFAMFQTRESDTTSQETRSHEIEFNNIALNENIELIGLETAKDQISLFDNLPESVQSEMVMEQVRGTDAEEGFTALSELYLTQNIDTIYHYIHDGDSYFASFEEAFLTRRNQNWIPKIISITKEQHAFIAVGAGHLGGPNGVVRLLRKEGFTVTPIKL